MKELGHLWNRGTSSLRFLTEVDQQIEATEKVLDIHCLRRNETMHGSFSCKYPSMRPYTVKKG
jgi:hypothetical protein